MSNEPRHPVDDLRERLEAHIRSDERVHAEIWKAVRDHEVLEAGENGEQVAELRALRRHVDEHKSDLAALKPEVKRLADRTRRADEEPAASRDLVRTAVAVLTGVSAIGALILGILNYAGRLP